MMCLVEGFWSIKTESQNFQFITIHLHNNELKCVRTTEITFLLLKGYIIVSWQTVKSWKHVFKNKNKNTLAQTRE